MSKRLLLELNGTNGGYLKRFIDSINGEPRIAWYPSAGGDFRALLYLDLSYSRLYPLAEKEPDPPDIFIFTDY